MYEIELFGTTTVRAGGAVLGLDALPGGKPRKFLEMISLAAGAVVSKERLVDQMWGASPPRQAIATLETYVSVLRRAIEPGVPGRATIVRTAPGGYRLDVQRAGLDLLRFDHAAAAAAATPDDTDALELWERAAALAGRPLLEHEPFAEWTQAPRRHYRRRAVEAGLRGARCALRAGHLDRATELAQFAVDRDPLEEDGWQALITALGARGNRTAAARAFGECRSVLRDELGLSPGPQTLRVLRHALDATVDAGYAGSLVTG